MDQVEKHLEAHIDYLKEEYQKGNFVASGRKVPRTGGVLFSKLNSKETVQKVVEKDPFYIENVAEFDITEVSISMTADGFEALKD